MASRSRPRFYILFGIVLAFLVGCATTGQLDEVKKELEQVRQLAEMGAAGSVGASFYPATALTGGGTGACDKITSTADGDVCFVVLHDDATYGDAILFYVLDADSACGADDGATPPKFFQAADGGNECWEMAGIITLKANSPMYVMSDADGETLEAYEVANSYIRATGAGTFNLPDIGTATNDAPIGSSFCIETVGDVNVSINPDDSDTITLEGVTDTAGHQLDNPSSSQDGTTICLVACQATDWCAPQNPDSWVAGS